jgi:hypothetical protein
MSITRLAFVRRKESGLRPARGRLVQAIVRCCADANRPLSAPRRHITEATAVAFKAAIKDKITSLRDGLSPMHESIPGYPTDVDPRKATTTRNQLAELAAFQTKVRAVRAAPVKELCKRT